MVKIHQTSYIPYRLFGREFLFLYICIIMGKNIYNKRSFLNKPGYHSNAVIVTDISDCRKDGFSDPFWGHYKITDCENIVNIAIDLGNVEELNNTLHKLDKIISVTQAYRDKIQELKPKLKKHLKNRKKSNKKKS